MDQVRSQTLQRSLRRNRTKDRRKQSHSQRIQEQVPEKQRQQKQAPAQQSRRQQRHRHRDRPRRDRRQDRFDVMKMDLEKGSETCDQRHQRFLRRTLRTLTNGERGTSTQRRGFKDQLRDRGAEDEETFEENPQRTVDHHRKDRR